MTREEAIKVIHKMLAYTDLSVRANLTADMVNACHWVIKALEQEPRWIPVIEKLPDPGEDVLVTVNLGSVNVVGVDEYSLVEEDGFVGYGKDVIAWMSFPKPYEPQESEE